MSTPNQRLVSEYLAYLRDERNRRPQTIYSNRQVLRRFVRRLNGRPLGDVTIEELREFIVTPTEKTSGREGPDTAKFAGMPPSANTRKNRTVYVRQFFGWLHAEGKIATNPAHRLSVPTIAPREPTPVTDDVWKALWDADLTDLERVAYGLGYFCGLRRMEIMESRAAFFKGGKIIGFTRKGGSRIKPVPWLSCIRKFHQHQPELIGHKIATFADPLQRVLKEHPTGLLFEDWQPQRSAGRTLARPDEFIDPKRLNVQLARTLDRVGLRGVTLTPHALRHGFGTKMTEFGVPITSLAKLMGHVKITTTEVYIKLAEDPLAAFLDDDGDDFSPWQ